MFMDHDDFCDIRDEFYGPDYDDYDYEGQYCDEYNNYPDDDEYGWGLIG